MENQDDDNKIPSLTFEDFKNENGITFWWATEFMLMLGYKSMKEFQKVLDRATKAFMSLNISHYENIMAIERVTDDEKTFQDFKLTRFACYIIAMNGNPKYEQVAQLQAYFANQTRKFEMSLEANDEVERIVYRDELIEGNKSLMSTAKQAGITNYANFQNAGYRGMYNMYLKDMEKKRKIEGRFLDSISRAELAANLFRVTLTDERIKNKGVRGQANLEQTHFEVGREIREIVQRNSGENPENMKIKKEISEVKRELKKGHKHMSLEDKPKAKKKR